MIGKNNISSIVSLLERIPERTTAIECTGLSGSEQAYLLAEICRRRQLCIVVVLSTMKAAIQFSEDLRFFSQEISRPILSYPPYNILPHKHLAYHSETAAGRISTLYRLINEDLPPVVVTTTGALMKRVLPKRELLSYAELVMVNEDVDRDQLVEKLLSGGYFQSTIVEEPGDFSVRGGIMDLFSPLYPNPVRIEFFGDTVDTIRFFDAANQRKIQNVDEAIILPAREAIMAREHVDQVVRRVRDRAAAIELPVTEIRELVHRVRNERIFSGIESMMPIVYPELDTFFDFVPDNVLFVSIEPGDLEKSAGDFMEQVTANFVTAKNDSRFYIDPLSLYMEWPAVQNRIAATLPLTVKTLPVSADKQEEGAFIDRRHYQISDNTNVTSELNRSRNKERLLLPLVNWIGENQQLRIMTCLVCRTRAQAQRLKSLLIPYGSEPVILDGLPKIKPHETGIYICRGEVGSGFVWPGEAIAFITAEEIFGTMPRIRKGPGTRSRSAPVIFSDLKKGDLVVHIEHGIGQYEGLAKLRVNGSTNDFLLIMYKDADKLYLPVDRMSMIQKYMGAGGATPVLSKMGGKAWQRVKGRIKKSAEKIAGELLKLYAARRVEKGHAFGKSDEYFREFEAGFSYEETPDQFRAIDDVLRDMEAQVPMDRLVCGDVGYGKTEVALRAAFKAVNDNKQVAVLVPTTVLAEQHFKSFSDRFERYAVNVASLNRFRTLKEQRNIVRGMNDGSIDIVIGTHRLIQKDVAFKDLGLLIFDEEHRFGVKHKEKLKRLRKSVDVLALTATPIPRTLHLSLSGIRDISTISTPPEHRRAIITYISELNDSVISSAIRKELSRNGQIFFIHNNIHSIWKMAEHLQSLVPEVKLGVAHGRMSENELEQVMLRFMNREIDMLVCTTIVESGLDIPSANSILINRADRLGLAQMYQLRGRVGRADEQAFAYLFIPPESHLSKDAQKRLKVLMEHSDLGSGFDIAMSDLKIRGGGTILGASQSGHIAAVGYDMYLKLMEQAVAELKGKPVVEPLEPEINISFSAFMPESFIPDIDQRLSAYRRLARMTDLDEIAEFKAELADRFGTLPPEATNLLLKIILKILSIRAGVKRMDLEERRLTLQFSKAHLRDPEKIIEFVKAGDRGRQLSPEYVFRTDLPKNRKSSRLVLTRNILKEIAQHGNA